MKCSLCQYPMQTSWKYQNPATRIHGYRRKARGSLCNTCVRRIERRRARQRETGTSATSFRSRAEVLEDYAMIKDDVSSIAEAAERMGMLWSTLDRALYRARLDGHAVAMPPKDQLERAIARGQPYRSAS